MVKANKIILKTILVLSYVLIISVIIFLISAVYSYFNTGADRSKILHTKIKKIDQYIPKVTWLKDGNQGREMNEQTLLEIENNYLDAWYVKNIAFNTNLKIGIDDYYTESARKNIYNTIAANKKQKITIERTTLRHNPNVILFSEDGQLVVLEEKILLNIRRFLKIINSCLKLPKLQLIK